MSLKIKKVVVFVLFCIFMGEEVFSLSFNDQQGTRTALLVTEDCRGGK